MPEIELFDVIEEKIEEIIDSRIIVRKKSLKRYINGVDLHNCLVNYYGRNNFNQPIPTYIGECLLHIANNLANKINFSSYSFKEEMIGDAVLKMTEAVVEEKYDADISKNPFAYFTQIAWNCFLQCISKEKKQSYIVHKNLDMMSLTEDMHYDDEDYRTINGVLGDDNHTKIINDFEKPKDKSISHGYTPHRNLSYKANREKKGRKKKLDNIEGILYKANLPSE